MKFRKIDLKNSKSSFPSLKQWRKLPDFLSKKERVFLLSLILLAFISASFLFVGFYYNKTKIKPAIGGTYVEGLVGQPRFINPVYADTSDVDRDLTEIIFSGLMKYDSQGKLVEDLAESYEIKGEGKIYEFTIKEDILWSDGEQLTVDDIIFTVKTIQNPDYKSPIRAEWLGVEMEKLSNYKIKFVLKRPSFVFLESTTLKILPKHIWEDISPENFSMAFYNLEPVGSGPYKLEEINKDKLGSVKDLTLVRNPHYYREGPYISVIKFKFFNSEEELIKAAKRGEIEGISLTDTNYYSDFEKGFFHINKFVLPRYFAVFFNTEESTILEEREVREALTLATNKTDILTKVLSGHGRAVNSPLMPEIYGYSSASTTFQFDIEKAKEILEEIGYKDLDGDGFRERFIEKERAFEFTLNLTSGNQGQEVTELQKCLAKDSEVYPDGTVSGYFGEKTKEAVIKFQEKYTEDVLAPYGLTSGTGKVGSSTRAKLNEVCFPPPTETISLQFALVTVDQPQLKEAANLLKEQWSKVGVNLEIKTMEINDLERNFIKPREYDALLFGEVLGAIPDPFPFWHSTQKKDPGLNLSIYENEEADKFIEAGRESEDFETQKENYENLQEILINDCPAVFLYSPDYLYAVKKEIKGINSEILANPSKRFSDIENWYINTKRDWSK